MVTAPAGRRGKNEHALPVPDEESDVGRQARRAERASSSQLSLSPRFDAALHAVILEKLHLGGHAGDALRFTGSAIEALPGDPLLLGWEAALHDGTANELDITRV
jgi:hypothetical protein